MGPIFDSGVFLGFLLHRHRLGFLEICNFSLKVMVLPMALLFDSSVVFIFLMQKYEFLWKEFSFQV